MEIEDILEGGWPPSCTEVRALLDEACVDAYDEYEQIMGMHSVFEEHGALPCRASVLAHAGELVTVEDRGNALVGIVDFRGLGRLPIPLEDVEPEPGGAAAFLVAMYRLWRGLEPISRTES